MQECHEVASGLGSAVSNGVYLCNATIHFDCVTPLTNSQIWSLRIAKNSAAIEHWFASFFGSAGMPIGGTSVAETVGDTDIQPNQPGVSAAKVGRYAESMKNGSFKWDNMGLNEEGEPDLIKIYQADNGKFLWNGNHRFVAAKLAGKEIPEEAIDTEVIEGEFEPEVTGWEDVIWLP